MLAREVTEKLSPYLRARWCDYAEEYGRRDEPDIIVLSRFMMREADRALCHAYSNAAPARETPARRETITKKVTTVRREERKPRTAAIYATTQEEKGTMQCLCCGSSHRTAECKKLLQMNVDQRWNWTKEQGICFKCISSRHRRFRCKAKRCGTNGCNAPHHALLHADKAQEEETAAKPDTKGEKVIVASTIASCDKVLLKVCPVTVQGPNGSEVQTYALLDEGSTVSLIDANLASEIGANGPTKPLSIRSVASTQSEPGSQMVKIKIKGRTQPGLHTINARTVNDLTLGTQSVGTDCLQFKHMKGLSKEICYKNATPKILLGADNWHLIISRDVRVGRKKEPIAARTLLGWIVQGTMPKTMCKEEGENEDRVLHIRATSLRQENEELNDLLKWQYGIDSLGISLKPKPLRIEERAIETFERTVKLVDGHYQVGLPWREDDVITPPSYEMAARRLRTIEKKMDQSPDFRDAYTKQVNNLFEKGYAKKAVGTEKEDPKCWFLPHFAVTNPNKPGKMRMVFDAAARTSGVCLNDFLLDGPDLLQNLSGVLFKFREKEIAISADIREMFLRIKIDERDQPAQMFLWRGDDRSNPPQEFVMTSMIFGARSSPFLAHSVRDHNARAHAATHPRALEAITKHHYMDDYLDSYESVEEAQATAKEVVEVHARAGFVLAGWNSNNASILEDVPEDLRAREPKEMGDHHEGKTLGMLWIAEEDALTFNTSMNRVPNEVKTFRRAPTKREALSAVMSVFDPLGLLSYLTITAKILLQDLWRLKKLSWDDALPEDAAEEFQRWLRTIEDAAKLRIPRCYAPTGGVVEQQLHVFCDASERAYSTAAYWRFKYEDGTVKVTLAAAKAKVAPIKTQSVPRLELQGNLIGARLADDIIKGHRIKPTKTIMWTDSQTTLQWIRNDTVRYSPYVAHRLGEIAERTSPDQWRWVPTANNIADQATRANFEVKSEDDPWFTGPAFLHLDEEQWPQRKQDSHEDHEETVSHCVSLEEASHLPDITRFSSYERLIRTTARVLQFVDRLKKRSKELELRHILEAEKLWIKRSQVETFAEDLSRISQNKRLRKGSMLSKLDPIMEDSLLGARGRINAAAVASSTKKPIILDGRHPFTQLLIHKAHEEAQHANRERVVNDLRMKYYILKLRPTVRKIEARCMRCRVRKATPRAAVTGDLPVERLGAFSRPFTNTGLDFFGPMIVTIGRRHEKRWVALFTCLTTRAVHVELVYSLSTDSAIMALRRMAARRGWPRTIYSDNGTNFHGADTELKRAIIDWEPELRDFALQRRINWKFIAPGAPNQGGAWERLVRSIKVALEATLREKHPREESLITLLAEAENCVNSRPLTHVPVNLDDDEALTPNHFLLGGPAGLPTIASCTPADRKAWKAAQGLADEYWRRWIKEYLPTLVARGEARGSEQAIAVGDVVIICDSNMPRNVWPRGIVTRVFPGPDGLIRNVEVKTKGGILRRPTRKLAVLTKDKEASNSTPGGGCCGQRTGSCQGELRHATPASCEPHIST